MGRIVLHIGSSPRLRYVITWYGYSKADGAAEPPQHIMQHFIDIYWRRIDERRKRKAYSTGK